MYYGFDIGGTKIEFAAFDDSLTCVAKERVLTPTDNYQAFINTVVGFVEKYDAQFNCKGKVGIGIPGIEQSATQLVLTVNIAATNNKPLRKDLEKRLERSVAIANDANCFALSEALGIGKKESMLGLILGTGFGGAMVIEGKVYAGFNSLAGELGHQKLTVDAWQFLSAEAIKRQLCPDDVLLACQCGKKGCLDNYLSGRGFETLYRYFFHTEKSAIEITKGFYQAEADCVEYVDLYCEMLAMCLGNILTCHDPKAVVFGGGLSNFEHLYDTLPDRVANYILPSANVPQLSPAKYGDSGGVRGAAFLNLEH